MPEVVDKFNISGSLLREARKKYQKGHLLDPDRRDRITEVIAEKIGVKPETLYKMERDQYTMTLDQLKKLAEIYGIALLFNDKTITVEVNKKYENNG
jgi:transcriptional regulator with XRE-family HTH domain